MCFSWQCSGVVTQLSRLWMFYHGSALYWLKFPLYSKPSTCSSVRVPPGEQLALSTGKHGCNLMAQLSICWNEGRALQLLNSDNILLAYFVSSSQATSGNQIIHKPRYMYRSHWCFDGDSELPSAGGGSGGCESCGCFPEVGRSVFADFSSDRSVDSILGFAVPLWLCGWMCSAVGLVSEAGVGTAEPASHRSQESCQSNEAVAGSKSLQQGPSVPGRLVQQLL